MLKALVTASTSFDAATDRNCLTRSPVDLALALFSYFVLVGGSIHPHPCADALRLRQTATRWHSTGVQLGALRRVVGPGPTRPPSSLSAVRRSGWTQCCACTHYLVFKEPDAPATPGSPPLRRFRLL